MDASKMAGICLQLVQAFTAGGSQQDVRRLIQEEMQKSSTKEQNDMLRKVMQILEQKHNAELQETARERDQYKIEAELLKQQMNELMKEQKSTEERENLTKLLTMMAGMNIKPQQNSHHQNPYHKKNPHQRPNFQKPTQNQQKNNNQDDLLPWFDNPKGNNLQQHTGGNLTNPLHFKNNLQKGTGEASANTPCYKNYNQQSSEDSGKPYYKKKFTNNNASDAGSSNFRGTPRGRPYRGRGQVRGRSQSLGRLNQNQFQNQREESSQNTFDPPAGSTTYNIQVTKVAGSHDRYETDNMTQINAAQRGRGRGNFRGRVRGAGRGLAGGRGKGIAQNKGMTASGNDASWEMLNIPQQLPENFHEKKHLNKNRRGARQPQNEHVRRGEKDDTEDLKDECVVM